MPLDKSQLVAFVDCMIGWKSVGVAGDEEITQPVCPEMRAFVVARLGDKTPSYGRQAVHHYVGAADLARLLREVADGLDPQSEAAP